MYQFTHLFDCLTVYDVIGKFLIIADGAVIDTDIAYFHISLVAVYGDWHRSILTEIITGSVDVCLASDSVDVKLHQSAIGTFAYDKSDFQPHIRGKLHRYTDRGFKGSILGFNHLCTACKHGCFFRCYLEALIAVHTTDDGGIAVHNIAYAEFELKSCACCTYISFKRSVSNSGFGSVYQLQNAIKPTGSLEVCFFKNCFHITGFPSTGIVLLVASSCSIKFELQTIGRLIDVYATFHHIDIERVFGYSADKLHHVLALLGKAVAIYLRTARYTHTLRNDSITEYNH